MTRRAHTTLFVAISVMALGLLVAMPADAQRVLTGNSGQRDTNSGIETGQRLDITRGTASDLYRGSGSNREFNFYEQGSGSNRYSFLNFRAGRSNDVSAVHNDVSGNYGGPLGYRVYIKPAPSGPPAGNYSQARNVRIDSRNERAYQRAVERIYIDADAEQTPSEILDPHPYRQTGAESLAYSFGHASAAIIKAAIPNERSGYEVRYRNGEKPYSIVYVDQHGNRRATPR